MSTFQEDWRTARDDDLTKMVGRLLNLGAHRKALRTDDGAAVREALQKFDRSTLPTKRIAELVGLTETRVRQIGSQLENQVEEKDE